MSITFIISNITNAYYPIKEYLESHLLSKYHQVLSTQSCLNMQQSFKSHPIASSFFTNTSDILNIIFLSIKAFANDHCCRVDIIIA